MNIALFTTIKTIFQITTALISLLINSLLIYLIRTKSPPTMGNYRHLMVFFCTSSIFFSIMDVVVRPVIYSHKSSFFMLMNLRHSDIPVFVAHKLVCILAGCFGVIIYGIAIHFIFRYFSLELKGREKYFDTQYLPFWFLIPILGGVLWTGACIFPHTMEKAFSEYIREVIQEEFGMSIHQVAFIGAVFWPRDDLGNVYFNYKCGVRLLMYLVLSSIPFNTILYCAVKSIGKIEEFPVSAQGKELQMQLYKALIAQTIIPVTLLFVPFTFFFILPFFEIDCTALSNIMTFVYALYPVIDPLPIFFFVENYKVAVMSRTLRVNQYQYFFRNETSAQAESSFSILLMITFPNAC